VARDGFGSVTRGAGDLNGDGFDDLVVLAPYRSNGPNSQGTALVYFGGPLLDAVADLEFHGEATGNIGTNVATRFDFNGDGFTDIAFGAPAYTDGAHANAGRVYILFGGPSFDSAYDVALTGD